MDSLASYASGHSGHNPSETRVAEKVKAIRPRDSGIPRSDFKRSFQTETSKEYNEKGIHLRRNMKPIAQALPDQLFQGMSVNAADFQGRQGTPTKSFKPANQIDESADNRDFNSEARRRFQNHGYQAPRASMKPEGHSLTDEKFDGVTTNQADYIETNGLPARAIRPSGTTIAEPGKKFEGTSQYSSHFTGDAAQPVRSMKPDSSFQSAGKFISNTTNRDQFQSWNSKPAELVKPIDARRAAVESRDFQTEASNVFNDKGNNTRKSLKPERSSLPDQRFEGESVATADYKDWQSAPAEILRPKYVNVQKKDDRDFLSEHERRFGAYNYQAPPRTMRPENKPVASGNFDSSTTNKSAFDWKNGKPATPIRNSTSTLGNNGKKPFEGTSQYTSNFTGESFPPVRSIIPESNQQQLAPFEGTSEYRGGYKPFIYRAEAPVC